MFPLRVQGNSCVHKICLTQQADSCRQNLVLAFIPLVTGVFGSQKGYMYSYPINKCVTNFIVLLPQNPICDIM